MLRRRARGFTLVEVLIAMAITALVAALAYSGISTVLIGAEQLRTVSQRTRDLNRTLYLLDRDIRQFVARAVRDEFGDLQPALRGGDLALFPLTLTREGWHNSLDLPRSELQRVHYYLEDDELWRAYYPVLDRAVDVQLSRVRLMDGIESLEWRFLDSLESLRIDRDLVVDTRGWAQSWVAEPGGSQALAPPVALELSLELFDLGLIRRFYVLPVR